MIIMIIRWEENIRKPSCESTFVASSARFLLQKREIPS